MRQARDDSERVEFVADTFDAAEALAASTDERSHDDDRQAREWMGSALAEAREWSRSGWESGVAALTADLPPHVSVSEVPAYEYSLAEEGSEVDVAAWLNGEEQYMGDMRYVPQPKPLVRIAVDVGTRWDVSAAEMLRTGRLVLAAVERLRASGYPVELHAVAASRSSLGSKRLFVLRVVVQAADAPAHAGIVAFFCAHPSALRRAVFALRERVPDAIRREFGFGRYGNYGISSGPALKDEYDEFAPSPNAGEAAAQAWLRELLERRQP